ncbi:Rab effector Noc2-like protein, partial [Dinothrombium tinctorium]
MSSFDTRDKWVPPNDRELTLRAKLDSGWSVKGGCSYMNTERSISENEQATILDVIKRAQQVEMMEKNRIGRLIDRLNNMKRNAKGDGNRYCALCNDEFGLFGAHHHCCKDCNKAVCSKCGVDTFTSDKEPIWLCKICSESRELWKKSGAWFFNSMPKFPLTNAITVTSSDESTSRNKESGSSNGSNGKQLTYNRSSRNNSPNLSPVIRRKSRSPSPRKYRFGIANEHSQATEFGAALEAGHLSDDENNEQKQL